MVVAPAPRTLPANPPPTPRRAPRYAWAQLLARIYEASPLLCPLCATEMHIVAFITDPSTVRAFLAHLGEPIRPPTIAPARGPPLWDMPEAARGRSITRSSPTAMRRSSHCCDIARRAVNGATRPRSPPTKRR
jgi:hypothetical protein